MTPLQLLVICVKKADVRVWFQQEVWPCSAADYTVVRFRGAFDVTYERTALDTFAAT